MTFLKIIQSYFFTWITSNHLQNTIYFNYLCQHILITKMFSKHKGLTRTFNAQNLASCRKVLVGLRMNAVIIAMRANGLTYGGILREELYKKLRTLRAHTTPNIAASSMICCSERWLRGSSSNISTWFTPDDRHPYTLIPIRNKNSTMRRGPLYSRNTILQSSCERWKMPKCTEKYTY